MPAYVIVGIDVTHPEEIGEYALGVPATLEPYGGRFVVRGGPYEVMEGAWDIGKVVIFEFPNADHAKAWHASDAYQAIVPLRQQHAKTHFFLLVDGVDDPD